jgi:hypothetical protein
MDEIRGTSIIHAREKKYEKKKFVGMPEKNVFLGCEILGSCCDVVVFGSTLFWDVTQQPRLRNVPHERLCLARL